MGTVVGGARADQATGAARYLQRLIDAYRTPFGFVLLLAILVGVVLAVVFADARWLVIGVLGAVLSLPLKLHGLRRSIETSRTRQISATIERVDRDHRNATADIARRLAALGDRLDRREGQLQSMAADAIRLSDELKAEVRSETDAVTESLGLRDRQAADSYDRLREEVKSIMAATRRSILVDASLHAERIEAMATSSASSTGELEDRLGGLEQKIATSNREMQVDFGHSLSSTRSHLAANDELLRQLSEQLGQLKPDIDRLRLAPEKVDELSRQVASLGDITRTQSRLAADFAALSEAHAVLQTRLGATRQSLRAEFANLAAQQSPRLGSAERVVLVLSPQRSGTTFAHDLIRSLPGHAMLSSYELYEALGAAGNRYPWDLLQDTGDGQAIAVRNGIGGVVPLFAPFEPEPVTYVEKLHPSSMNFEVDRFVDAVEQLQASAVVSIVLLVRDPVDAMASFLSYQARGQWHGDLDADQVPALFLRSYEMMQQVHKRLPGAVVLAYASLRDDPAAVIARLSGRLFGRAADPATVARIVGRIDERRLRPATTGTGFFGQRSTPSGIATGQLDVGLSPLLGETQSIYRSLVERDGSLLENEKV